MTETICATRPKLPAAAGHVLDLTERPARREWLVDQIIVTGGVSAFAPPTWHERLALGVLAADAVLSEAGNAALFGCPVRRRAASVLVLATSERTALTYRGVFAGDARVSVAAITGAGGTWADLYTLAQGAGLVIIDSPQDVDKWNEDPPVARALRGFPCAVLSLYTGNGSKPGVPSASAAMWNDADCRCWLNAKSELHALDTDLPPWHVELPTLGAVLNRAYEPEDPDADERERVRAFAQLAVERRADRDTGRALLALNEEDPDRVRAIWGTTEMRVILPAVGRHTTDWESIVAGVGYHQSDAPPF